MASHQPRPQTARPQAGRPPSSNPQSRKAAAVEGTKDDFVELMNRPDHPPALQTSRPQQSHPSSQRSAPRQSSTEAHPTTLIPHVMPYAQQGRQQDPQLNPILPGSDRYEADPRRRQAMDAQQIGRNKLGQPLQNPNPQNPPQHPQERRGASQAKHPYGMTIAAAKNGQNTIKDSLSGAPKSFLAGRMRSGSPNKSDTSEDRKDSPKPGQAGGQARPSIKQEHPHGEKRVYPADQRPAGPPIHPSQLAREQQSRTRRPDIAPPPNMLAVSLHPPSDHDAQIQDRSRHLPFPTKNFKPATKLTGPPTPPSDGIKSGSPDFLDGLEDFAYVELNSGLNAQLMAFDEVVVDKSKFPKPIELASKCHIVDKIDFGKIWREGADRARVQDDRRSWEEALVIWDKALQEIGNVAERLTIASKSNTDQDEALTATLESKVELTRKYQESGEQLSTTCDNMKDLELGLKRRKLA